MTDTQRRPVPSSCSLCGLPNLDRAPDLGPTLDWCDCCEQSLCDPCWYDTHTMVMSGGYGGPSSL